MGQVNFHLPDDDHREARLLAVEHGKSLNGALPDLVEVGLKHADELEWYSAEDNEEPTES